MGQDFYYYHRKVMIPMKIQGYESIKSFRLIDKKIPCFLLKLWAGSQHKFAFKQIDINLLEDIVYTEYTNT